MGNWRTLGSASKAAIASGEARLPGRGDVLALVYVIDFRAGGDHRALVGTLVVDLVYRGDALEFAQGW